MNNHKAGFYLYLIIFSLFSFHVLSSCSGGASSEKEPNTLADGSERVNCPRCHVRSDEVATIVNKKWFYESGHGKPRDEIYPFTGNSGADLDNLAGSSDQPGDAKRLSCASCHDPLKDHGGKQKRLRDRFFNPDGSFSNNGCYFCHWDGILEFANEVRAHLWGNAVPGKEQLKCIRCHDPHGTPNGAMFQETIKIPNVRLPRFVGGKCVDPDNLNPETMECENEHNPLTGKNLTQGITSTDWANEFDPSPVLNNGLCDLCHEDGTPVHTHVKHPGNVHGLHYQQAEFVDNEDGTRQYNNSGILWAGIGNNCIRCHNFHMLKQQKRGYIPDYKQNCRNCHVRPDWYTGHGRVFSYEDLETEMKAEGKYVYTDCPITFDDPAWTPQTEYAVGDKVRPVDSEGNPLLGELVYFVVRVAGTSGETEPAWETIAPYKGQPVEDGTGDTRVTWRRMAYPSCEDDADFYDHDTLGVVSVRNPEDFKNSARDDTHPYLTDSLSLPKGCDKCHGKFGFTGNNPAFLDREAGSCLNCHDETKDKSHADMSGVGKGFLKSRDQWNYDDKRLKDIFLKVVRDTNTGIPIPDESRSDGLMRDPTEFANDGCLRCHLDDDDNFAREITPHLSENFHYKDGEIVRRDVFKCIKCHDPHGTNNGAMLRPTITFDGRTYIAESLIKTGLAPSARLTEQNITLLNDPNTSTETINNLVGILNTVISDVQGTSERVSSGTYTAVNNWTGQNYDAKGMVITIGLPNAGGRTDANFANELDPSEEPDDGICDLCHIIGGQPHPNIKPGNIHYTQDVRFYNLKDQRYPQGPLRRYDAGVGNNCFRCHNFHWTKPTDPSGLEQKVCKACHKWYYWETGGHGRPAAAGNYGFTENPPAAFDDNMTDPNSFYPLERIDINNPRHSCWTCHDKTKPHGRLDRRLKDAFLEPRALYCGDDSDDIDPVTGKLNCYGYRPPENVEVDFQPIFYSPTDNPKEPGFIEAEKRPKYKELYKNFQNNGCNKAWGQDPNHDPLSPDYDPNWYDKNVLGIGCHGPGGIAMNKVKTHLYFGKFKDKDNLPSTVSDYFDNPDLYKEVGKVESWKCIKCHNPHGSSNGAMLHPYIDGRKVGGEDGIPNSGGKDSWATQLDPTTEPDDGLCDICHLPSKLPHKNTPFPGNVGQSQPPDPPHFPELGFGPGNACFPKNAESEGFFQYGCHVRHNAPYPRW